MKKQSVVWLAALVLLGVAAGVVPAAAKINLEATREFQLPESPQDVAFSRDGFTLYILGQKSVMIYSLPESKVMDTIPLKKPYSNISISPDETALFLAAKDSPHMTAIQFSQVYDIETGSSPVIGNPKAKVTIAAFVDYQCPFCAKVYPILQEILKKYPNDVKLVIKHFPLPMHKFAEKASLSALAAARQGKYEKVTELFFANYGSLNDDSIRKYVQDAGADMQKFEKDVAEPEVRQQIQKDQNAGRQARVKAVPTIFINGISPKNRSVEGFSQIIDQELAKKK